MKTVRNLRVEFKTLTDEQKRAMLSPEEQKAMKARTAAVKAYMKALSKSGEVAKNKEALNAEKTSLTTKKK
jgi:hypothetical protein